MYKLKNGIELFPINTLKLIASLIDSIKTKNLRKLYFSMTKNYLIESINKFKNQKPISTKGLSIAKDLNEKYTDLSKNDSYGIESFLNLLEKNFESHSLEPPLDIYYKIINLASSSYNLPQNMTPARKADSVSTNTYINLLKNLKIILQSMPENQLNSTKITLDNFLVEISEKERLNLKDLFQLENLNGQKTFELMVNQNFHYIIKKNNSIPEILIKTVNVIISTLCDSADGFTVIQSKLRYYILFSIKESLYWIFDISPYKVLKGTESLFKDILSIIIFLSKMLMDGPYTPLDKELPSFKLSAMEKKTLIKRNENYRNICFKIDKLIEQLRILESKLNHSLKNTSYLSDEKSQVKATILANEKELKILTDSLLKKENKLNRLSDKLQGLNSKQGSNLRIEEKIISLNNACDALRNEIETLKKKISNGEKNINENEDMADSLAINLLNHNRKISELKIEIAVIKKQITSLEQEKHQLKTSSAIYFSIHWGNSFNLFSISSEVYDELITYDLKTLLLMESVLVELQESTDPRAVGYSKNPNKVFYRIPVKRNDRLITEINFQVNDEGKIYIKKIPNNNE